MILIRSRYSRFKFYSLNYGILITSPTTNKKSLIGVQSNKRVSSGNATNITCRWTPGCAAETRLLSLLKWGAANNDPILQIGHGNLILNFIVIARQTAAVRSCSVQFWRFTANSISIQYKIINWLPTISIIPQQLIVMRLFRGKK